VLIEISMPQLGLTMTEGTVFTWLKKPGDTVKKNEAILTVSTDKVDMDIESTVDGVLKEIIVNEGETVPVATLLAYIDAVRDQPVPSSNLEAVLLPMVEGDAQNEALSSASSTELRVPAALVETAISERHVSASPRAKRLAKQLGIDLTHVKSSGPGGRIIEKDLINGTSGQPINNSPQVDPRRQRIADRMVESITTIPAFSVSVEVNAEKLVALYENHKDLLKQSTGIKLTYTDLLLKALSLALVNTPNMKCVWRDGTVLRHTDVNLALAVATDRGVAAPVLMNVDRILLPELVTRRSEITDKTRQNKLTLPDLEGAVGTLSNLGMYRVDRFEGIIIPGQTFLLAVGRLQNRPWVDRSLVIKPTIILNLSVDHRVVDGAIAAEFLGRLAELIEQPDQITREIERK
jgi:pyruvate dehydrogenase E2 component (dihydrolipoamide acetyltransferase)